MSKNAKENVLGFVFMTIIAALAVWMVIRDIDKDVERTCGMKRFKNAPQMCVEWWNDKNVPMESPVMNGTERNRR